MERYRQLRCVITEKIDGTNASIYIPHDPAEPVIAGKRTSWLLDGQKNFGFETWVAEHAEALRRLGPGTHFGEWYGAGIQRRYGLDHKRFALFAALRWTLDPETGKGGLPQGLPPELGVVPILYRGVFDPRKVDETIATLYREGSVAVPGWRGPGKEGPEGVVIQVQGCAAWKLSDNGDAKKGRDHHVQAAIGAIAVREMPDGFTIVTGRTIDNVEIGATCGPGTNIKAAVYDIANQIVDADAKVLDARKLARKGEA